MKKPGVQPLPGGDCRGLWFIYEPKWTDLVYNTMIVSATASVRATHCLSANLWTWPWCTQPPAKHPHFPAPYLMPGPAPLVTVFCAKPLSFAFCFKAWSHSLPPPPNLFFRKVHVICFEYKSNEDILFIQDAWEHSRDSSKCLCSSFCVQACFHMGLWWAWEPTTLAMHAGQSYIWGSPVWLSTLAST